MPTLETEQPISPQEAMLGPQDLDQRIERAVKDCELLPTPEIREALSGYYSDHYALADTIDSLLTGSLSDEAIEETLQKPGGTISTEYFGDILKNYDTASFPAMPSAESAVRLLAFAVKQERTANPEEQATAHDTVLRCASSMLKSVLFREQSLGITTLGETEFAVIAKLHDELIEASQGTSAQITSDGRIEWSVNNNTSQVQVPNGHEAVTQIQQDQQKFWADTRHAGQLEYHNTGLLGDVSARGSLMPRTEQFRRDGTMNAQTAIGEQMHSNAPHFSEQFDPNSYKTGNPKEHSERMVGTVAVPLIKVIEAAPFARDAQYGISRPKSVETLDKVPLADTTTSIGVGHPDMAGPDGTDRVFLASPTESGDTMPDAYEIKVDRDATLILTGHSEIVFSQRYGLGEGFPGRLELEDVADAQTAVNSLQNDYLERYPGMVVVPLRRGIFDYVPENMAPDEKSWRHQATYNTNPTGVIRN